MNRPAGFVPANYRLAGKGLLTLSGLVLIATGLDALTGWFDLPSWVLIFGLVLIPIGLYLLLVPKDE